MKTFQQFNEDVEGIIKGGISSFLNKNKNIKVGDFLDKDKRTKTVGKIKNRGKNVLGNTLSQLGDHLKSK
tara:strand:+ start:253 stop:462 length:210 start_codon:yes stop_codon:yes gene_type:complete